ncbi:MAG: hypothetical protein L6428_04510 [Candidatus Aminicenantes bacterium]|nr:hypothetical protein [Candidatus Aminicenantes bacterium]
MRDFTLTIYKNLLTELLQSGYGFVTFAKFIQEQEKKEKTVILRHDVDKKPLLSLRTAVLENELGIKGTYYFRVVKIEFPREEIERIKKLGHEIGYHYDDLNEARGDMENALNLFQDNLAKLRELAPVKTACMHGSPLSRYDNRDLWKNFDYHDLGIIGEPYFDIDFDEVMYLTDTGRRWDGDRVSIRDKVKGDGREAIGDGEEKRGDREERRQKTEDREQKEEDRRGAVGDPPVFNPHSTGDIIKALKSNMLPDTIMLTIHPQRWTDNYFFWIKELVWQKIKNGVKYFVARGRGSSQ